ncbi:MAG: hypothetical protein AAF970_11180 [Bacteroidota bacterium]
MTATEARRIIAGRQLVAVYFTRKDGTERRLVGRYVGSTCRPGQMTLWDIEARGFRTVTLGRVREIKAFKTTDAAADAIGKPRAQVSDPFAPSTSTPLPWQEGDVDGAEAAMAMLFG